MFSGQRHRSYSDQISSSAHDSTGITNANNKMTPTTKKHSHSHRHHGNRPRSKSCDRHVHKKNSSTKHNHGTRSPGRHHVHGHHHVQGRVSPKNLPCQQLHGRLWIRPMVVNRSSHPFKPVLSSAAPQVDRNSTCAPISIKYDPLVRQVTGSPIHDDNEEMMWATSLAPRSLNSSFQSLQKRHGGTSPKNLRLIFGESGKPIQPRNAF